MTGTDTTSDTAAELYRRVAVPSIGLFGLAGIGEVERGQDLAELILQCTLHGPDPVRLESGDIIVITSKIVSKAEGRSVPAESRHEAIRSETARVVASRGPTQIVETHHGFVMAAAGVDASNTEAGTLLLLPQDPDASARRIRASLLRRSGVRVGVVVTDTTGRPWRTGLVDVALGAAGIEPSVDYRGCSDDFGNPLHTTVTAVVDEIAAAADLVKGKLSRVPIAVVRGLGRLVTETDGPGVRALIRSSDEDMFRQGVLE